MTPTTSNLRWLYTGRALRSFALAFLSVAFPLYLATERYSATRIGLVLAGGSAITIGLVAGVGILGDRFGRRRIILWIGLLAALGNLALFASHRFWVVLLASGLGGIGRGGGAGSGGTWGPVFPAEQPLVAASADPRDRTRVFGRLSFIGVMAGAAGSLVAGLPDWMHRGGWTLGQGYQALFLLGALSSFAMIWATLPVREPAPTATPAPDPSQAPPLTARQLMGRLGLTNAINGLAFGFMGPLLTYWFYRRYGVGPAELGILYTIVNLAAAFPYLGAAWLTHRLGAVRTVSVTRIVAAVLLLVMAWMPTFWLAGAAYIVRMMFNSLGMPARQSWMMGVSAEHMRGRMAAFSSLPAQATSMVSPGIGGMVMATMLDFPLYGAAFFFIVNAVAYFYIFRNIPAPEEQAPSSAGTG